MPKIMGMYHAHEASKDVGSAPVCVTKGVTTHDELLATQVNSLKLALDQLVVHSQSLPRERTEVLAHQVSDLWVSIAAHFNAEGLYLSLMLVPEPPKRSWIRRLFA